MNNLNLIIGEDKKLIDFYLLELLNKIKYSEDNKITYDLNESSITDILDEASMISLFASTKVIVGTNLDITKISDNEYDYLSKYLKNINKDAYIILISNKVDARSKIYKLFKENFNIIDATKQSNQDDLFIYIKNKAKDNKYEIDKINIDYFLKKVGNDINNINLELEKIFIYKEDDKKITQKDIDLLVTDNIDNIIYEFTNAVLENNQDAIIKMYNNFKIENVSNDYLISSLANTFRQALIIKMLTNDGKSNLDISKVIGKKEFYVKKMQERLYMYTENDLCRIINKIAKIDKDYKLSNNNACELELFLIDINR